MPIHFVVLWTDALIYLLVFVIAVFIFWARKREHLISAWHQICRNRLGMISMVFLLFFVSVGLLDSVHFQSALKQQSPSVAIQYSTKIKSVLDVLLSPVGQRYEKTYSAPFSTHLYVKMSVKNKEGVTVRQYPRLHFAGQDLKNPLLEKNNNILNLSLKAISKAIGIWVILCLLFIFYRSYKNKQKFGELFKQIFTGKTSTAWRSILFTLLALIILVTWSYELSRYYHIFGTDKVGQDVFYQTVKSIRTGLIIGTLTTLIMLPFAVLMGTMAGYYSGFIDDAIQYIYTTLNSIPGVLLIAASILSLQVFIANHHELFPSLAMRADARLLALCFILGITSWTGLCRILRGETLKLREVDYIAAAKSLGVSDFKIILKHILPNVMHIVIISVVLDFSGLVLAEAVLSYVGVGVDPTTHSWGNMINAARLQLSRDPVVWWPLLAAFVFMFVLVLSANLFSDAVRDAFDPRIRQG